MKMDVLIGEEGGALVCTLRGRLDTPASQEVMKAVQPLLEQADREIILDCRDLEYISSSGLRILLMLRKETGRKGGRLVIRGIREAIRLNQAEYLGGFCGDYLFVYIAKDICEFPVVEAAVKEILHKSAVQ